MDPLSPSPLEADEFVTLDDSTAPTTPDGSLSFSPQLQPQDVGGYVDGTSMINRGSLSSDVLVAAAQAPLVRNICCVGAGFVGGPTAAVIALHNPQIRVTVVDRDEKRIRRWNSRHPPIYEPSLDDILRITRDGSRECAFISGRAGCVSGCPSQCEGQTRVAAREPNLVFTTDLAKCVSEADIVLIAVNTPTKTRGNGAGAATDMAAFEAATALIAQHARPNTIIVEKSTLALHRPDIPFPVLSNPEFLAAGTAVHDLLHADRILIGSSPTPAGSRAAAALASVYASWIPASRIITTHVFSSELAKLVSNAMLAQRISSINSIAAVCDATGADVDEVARAIGADPRIGGQFLRAGIGFGGSCFKKDVLSLVYLAETLILPEVAAYWRAVVEMNEFARERFVARVMRKLNNTLAGKKVAVLGYAFKKDTNDTRESPALGIIHALLEEGPRELAVFDPLCVPAQMTHEIGRFAGEGVLQRYGGPVAVHEDVYAACRGADAVLITTEFDEFRNGPVKGGKGGEAASPADPRPFERAEPHETDLLALQSYLRQTTPGTEDPLNRFNPTPPCIEECPDCQLERSVGVTGESKDQRRKERVDWRKIYQHMSPLHWVFDGRGVLDVSAMEKIGFRVESVGRRSWTMDNTYSSRCI
ncbi:nucleotide sugar dehydrogenase [Parathielavia appendiculata]|uniref:UDP-glucose 6-dehydrogenase n=1 Tax=Parathielavia appendiculata TaxID=2587402 RepID=A0AAN6U6J9_9PEZI|nr:nucleotide sugar dehydrogenase [Parathielavia appendiculata]